MRIAKCEIVKVRKATSTSFKKGHISWSKGKKFPGRSSGEKNSMFGKKAWNKGLTKETDERVKKYSKKLLGQAHSKEWNDKISKSKKGKKTYKSWNKGLTKKTDERIKNGSIKMKGRTAWNKGIPWSEETKSKMRKPRSNTERMKWPRLEEHIKIIMKNPLKKGNPNKEELALFARVKNLSPGNYALNTKGEILVIGNRVPDIVNVNGEKKLVELFGDYYHSEKRTGRTKEQEEELRKSHFGKFGWSTLIIWGHELKNLQELDKKLRSWL